MNKENAQRNTIIDSFLNKENVNWQELLATIIAGFDCTTGTIHFLDEQSSLLKVQAHQGIPPFLVPKLSEIPIGKGMAGIAAERREPVEMCNLQTDDSGVVRPAAKETKVEGSIAVPMLLNGKLYGTLGIAKPVPYDFKEEEVSDLLNIGEKISVFMSS
ncbi:GAF domain-containing protein [Arenibacter sp. F26102]|uniref:GAF domain-containing protein n=1 Tax=Arenibacter sp. F26102 TaxID=2926416 RepID=UPI001FF346CE|nr:GAF domain-containing protein [Arenibacter sp. F26102]MCK0145530.1 GAF domain-containing protein [Arenibacter sp. F26102]